MGELQLPSFLVIGAMKAGTTSLYRDLLSSGGVYFSPEKETDGLASDYILVESGLRQYASMYSAARATDLCGDASTSYSKLPVVPSVPQRASEVLGPELRLIYMVRHPVDRIVSHHHFLTIRHLDVADINVAVRGNPDYVHFSQYWMQISAWLELFPREQILTVELERYAQERARVLQDIRSFLGLDPAADRPISDTIYNQTYGQPLVTGSWKRLSENPVYRTYIRPLLGVEFRRRVQLRLLPKSYTPPETLSAETLAYLHGELADDIARFQHTFGCGLRWSGFDGSSGMPK